MVTMRSSSSEVSSPALHGKIRDVEQIASTDVRVPLVQVDIGLLANQVGVTATDTLDLGQGVHDLLLAIDVGIEKTISLSVPGDKQCLSMLWLSQRR